MQKREIKFRAWYNEQMVYWNLSNMYASDTGELKADQYCQVTDLTNVLALGHFMQYTGLKDKNGKEIYEGDIVKYETGSIYIVVWGNSFSGMWLQNKQKFDNGPHGMGFESTEQNEIEVIGNIYSNPELL